jgi:hypothetical protein
VRVLVTDQTPDVPNRTSDHYLKSLLSEAAEVRGVEVEELIEELLELAWEEADSWEEVDLLERVTEAFGSRQARSLPDLDREQAKLEELRKRLKLYAGRWRAALRDLKRENFGRFLRQHSDWKALLEPAVLDSLDPEDRRGLRSDLLEELASFTAADLSMQIRLETMRDRHALADKARYRMEVRRATVGRVRSLLTRIAGRVHLQTSADSDQEAAFERLNSCEALTLEEPTAPLRSRLIEPEPFPSLDHDVRLTKEVAPGWLGIRFASAAPVSPKPASPLPVGAVMVEKVYAGSPAQRAGFRVGDVILGPPGAPFSYRNEVREWTMLSPVNELRELMLRRNDRAVTVSIQTAPYPLKLPE